MKKTSNDYYLKIFLLISSVIRVCFGGVVGCYFWPEQVLDDALFINYADLAIHFNDKNQEFMQLLKEMMFPIFLNIVHYSGLSLDIVISLMWVLAAYMVYLLLKRFTSDKILLAVSFLFVLFTPVAFDNLCGTRVYRNSIMSPFILITFSLLLILLYEIQHEKIGVKTYFIAFISGVSFFFTAYIKEDGMWLVACLLFLSVVYIINIFMKHIKSKRKQVSFILAACIPFLVYCAGTNIYKAINYHYFGVYTTNMRTSGEMGEFIQNVNKVQSDNRTTSIWTPTDAIEKVFEVSETLSNSPKLKEEIFHTPWCSGDIYVQQIWGDFLGWVLRDALVSSGEFQSWKQVNEYFKKVNSEIDAAFKDGRLQKDDKIQLVSSMGGRNISEILELRDDMLQQYLIHINLKEYTPGAAMTGSELENVTPLASYYTNKDLGVLSGRVNDLRQGEINSVNKIISVIFSIYKIIQPILFIIALFYCIFTVICELKKFFMDKSRVDMENITLSITGISLFGISLAYTLAIAWFCEGMELKWLKFYSIGIVPMIILIELMGSTLLYSFVKEKIKMYHLKNMNGDIC